MVDVCVSGMLAQKLGRTSILEKVVTLVKDFDTCYQEKYQGKTGFSLQRAIFEFRGELESGQMAAPFAKAGRRLAATQLTMADVDLFIAEVWKIWLKGSPVEEQIKAKLNPNPKAQEQSTGNLSKDTKKQ